MSSNDELSNEELWEKISDADLDDRADSLVELANRHFQDDNWLQAKNLYGSAADLYEKLGRPLDHARTLYWLANTQYRLEKTVEALSNLERALDIYREMNDVRGVGQCAVLIADCLTSLRKTVEAVEAYELAIQSFYELEDDWNLGVAKLSLGEIHGSEERLTRALECFLGAFNSFQRCGDAYGSARTKDRMASALVELGDFDQAIQHVKDAMDIFEFMEAFERVNHMKFRLGWISVLAGKYSRAIPPLRESIAAFKETKEWSRAALAEVQLANALRLQDKEEINEEAERLLTRTAAYFEAAGEISNLLMVDSISAEKFLEIGLVDEAIDLYRSIITRGEEIADDYIVRATKPLLAEALARVGELQEAVELVSSVSEADWGENQFELERLSAAKMKVLKQS